MRYNLRRRHLFLLGGVLLLLSIAAALLYLRRDPFAPCLSKEGTERGICVIGEATAIAKKSGIQAALDAIQSFPADPRFSAYCHPAVHAIGTVAYMRFSAGERLPISEDMHRCANGFFHGFLIEAVTQSGSLKDAAALCEKATGNTDSLEDNLPAEDCYHGIGNGIAENTAHPKTQMVALLKEARNMCRSISASSTVFRSCVGGVYNRIGNWYFRGYVPDTSITPAALCETVHDDTQSLCLEFVLTGVLSGDTLSEAVSDLPADLSGGSKEQVVTKVAMTAVKSGGEDEAAIIRACHELSASLSEACIIGSALGLVDLGAANEGKSEEVLTFCSAQELTDGERKACLYQAVPALKSYQGAGKVAELCAAAPENVRTVCTTLLR